MNSKNFLNSTLLAINLALAPSVSQAKNEISSEVFQLVGRILISTNMESIRSVKTFDCRDVNDYRIYLSDKKNIIATDNFDVISNEKVNKIKESPKCKN